MFYTWGKHAFKFGFLSNRFQLITGETVWGRGRLNFLGGLPAFLQNQPSQEFAAIPGGLSRRHFRYETYGFYGQDDWRVTSRLTLNLGLRYEFNTTPNESQGYQTTLLDPGARVDVVGGPGWTSPLTEGAPFRNPSLKNFSPRFGFAFDPIGKGKTALRGAFGIYYDVATIGSATFGYVVGDPPYRSLAPAFPTSFAPGFISANPGPWQPPFNNPGATNTFAGFSPTSPIGTPTHDIRQTYLESWNFSIDQQLPGGVALSASYVGTKGLHLWGQRDGNACIPTGYIGALPNWANTQGAGGTSAACPSVNLLFPSGHICTVNPPSGPARQIPSGRANCNLSYANQIQTTGASWYNALQVTVQKRLSHGLEFQSAYTFSKNLDLPQGRLTIDGEALTSPYAPLSYDRGRAVVDATHNLRFNLLYAFPMRNASGWVSKLLNGWSAQSIVSAQTGFAFSPAAPGDVSLNAVTSLNVGYERPDFVTADNLSRARQSNPNAVVYNPDTVITGDPNRWYNPNMFTAPLPGYLGNVGRGTLNGPGLFNLDFSLHKDTRLAALGEAGSLQFRAEFFNILNRANFVNNPPNGNGIVGPTAGALTTARDGRDIQIALKLIF